MVFFELEKTISSAFRFTKDEFRALPKWFDWLCVTPKTNERNTLMKKTIFDSWLLQAFLGHLYVVERCDLIRPEAHRVRVWKFCRVMPRVHFVVDLWRNWRENAWLLWEHCLECFFGRSKNRNELISLERDDHWRNKKNRLIVTNHFTITLFTGRKFSRIDSCLKSIDCLRNRSRELARNLRHHR